MEFQHIQALNGKCAVVVTSAGRPISIGRLCVEKADEGAAEPRVSVEFETETMRCAIRVAAARIPVILSTWDGERYTFTLPPGDVWVPVDDQPSTGDGKPVIETYSLPPPSPPRPSPGPQRRPRPPETGEAPGSRKQP